jgi:hypothetical protein
MKKLLLLLTLIVSAGISLSATTWESVKTTTTDWDAVFDYEKYNSSTAPTTWTDTSNELKAAWTFSYEWASTAVYFARTTNGIQLGSSNATISSFTLQTSDIPGTITAVTVEGVSSNGSTLTVKVTVGGIEFPNENTNQKVSSTASDYKFVGNGSGAITISITNIQSTKNIKLKGLKVEYTVEQKAVSDPKFTETEGENGFSVAMSCATDGASIYYTTDGSTPDANSTKYTAPITYTDPISIQAVAIANSESSYVANFSSSKYFRSDFADFIAGKIADNSTGVIKNTITAIYQNDDNLYVKAGDTYMLVYGNVDKTFSNGDTFNRLAGTYTLYKGTPEFTNPEIGEVTTGGEAVSPIEIADLSTLTAADANKYVLLKGVSIKELTATDANGKTIALFNKFVLESIAEGSNLDVTGIVNYFTQNEEPMQVYPIKIDGVIELGDIQVSDLFNDGKATITEGTTLTFKASNASKMVITDAEGKEVVTNEGNTVTWTPEYGEYADYKVTATMGDAIKEYVINLLKVAELPVGDVVASYGANNAVQADDELQVKQGVQFSFSAANALHIQLVAASKVVAEVEGNLLTWSPTDVDTDGTEYTVVAYRFEADAAKKLTFTVKVNAVTFDSSYDAMVTFSEQNWGENVTSYAKDVTRSWVSKDQDASGNPFSFTTTCSISGGSTYAVINNGNLRLYPKSNNQLTVKAPAGYQMTAVSFSIDTANSSKNIPYVDGKACTTTTTSTEEAESASQRATAVWEDYSYTFDSSVTSFVLEPKTSVSGTEASGYLQIKSATITLAPISTAINTIAADSNLDDAAAPVEYFNLQGQRIAAPAQGIFIRRQGNKVEKVVIR